MTTPMTPYQRVKLLQDLMVAKAGGDHITADNGTYETVRRLVLSDPRVPGILVPKVLRDHRDLSHFWSFAKALNPSWEPRRQYVRDQFVRLLDYLEEDEVRSPADHAITDALGGYDAESVAAAWTRALERRSTDPEGAITAARTLLETVLKHVLTEAEVPFEEGDDLPKLYRLASARLSLAPGQHTEDTFRRVLGGCASVVEGLGSIRNKIGDAHGHGPRPVRPAPRHATLVVNLAGSMATFIIETWQARQAD